MVKNWDGQESGRRIRVRLESSKRNKYVMLVTRRGMTGGMPPHPLVAHQGLFTLNFSDLVSLASFQPCFKVVGADYNRRFRLYEGIRFVLIATIKTIAMI